MALDTQFSSSAVCSFSGKSASPVIFACQGRSNLAQLANDLALIMDHEGLAVMGSLTSLVAESQDAVSANLAAKKILVLEGCCKGCVQALLSRLGAHEYERLIISDLGIAPLEGASCTYTQMNLALRHVQQRLVELNADPIATMR